MPLCSIELRRDRDRLRISLLILCHVEKAVHIGDPTSSMGFSLAIRFRARSLVSASSKSNNRASVSAVVESRVKPGMILSSGKSFVAAVTRGGEYISETIARIEFPRSR